MIFWFMIICSSTYLRVLWSTVFKIFWFCDLLAFLSLGLWSFVCKIFQSHDLLVSWSFGLIIFGLLDLLLFFIGFHDLLFSISSGFMISCSEYLRVLRFLVFITFVVWSQGFYVYGLKYQGSGMGCKKVRIRKFKSISSYHFLLSVLLCSLL